MLKTLHIVLPTFLILIIFINNDLNAQDTDDTTSFNIVKERHNLDSADTYIFHLNNIASYTLTKLDYPVANFNQISTFNPQGSSYVSLGNRGQAGYHPYFEPGNSNNIQVRPDVYSPFRLNIDSINFIRCEKPYSEASYMLGKQKEQRIDFIFNQKLGNNLYAGLRTRFGNAPGTYLHQRSYWAGAYFTLQFYSSNKRYNASLVYLTDRLTNYENGGIKYDSIFEQNLETNRRTILVNLDNAINRDKSHGIEFQHYYNLIRQTPYADSLNNIPNRKTKSIRLVHTFSYSRNTEVFDDKSNNKYYYPVTYFNFKRSYDSLSRIYINNTIAFTNIVPDTSSHLTHFQYAVGLEQNYDRLYFFSTDSAENLLKYNSYKLFGSLKLNMSKAGKFKAEGSFSQNGYYHNNMIISAAYYNNIILNKFNVLFQGGISYQQRSQDLIFKRFYSNHFQADYKLGNTDIKSLFSVIHFKSFYIELKNQMVHNYTFLDNDLNVQQYTNMLNILKVSVLKTISLKHFNSYLGIDYQKVDNETVLALPEIVAKCKFAYTTWLFNKAMQLETGISAFYYSAYYADEYMPSIRMFYRQTEMKYGNHIYADVFANVKIKRMRMFISYRHFNSSFTGYNYMEVPHYPQPDAGVEFGINWVFFD